MRKLCSIGLIVLIILTATACRNIVVIPVPPIDGGSTTGSKTYTAGTLDELLSYLNRASDGDTIFMNNVFININEADLPIRIAKAVNMTGRVYASDSAARNAAASVSLMSADSGNTDTTAGASGTEADIVLFEIVGNTDVNITNMTAEISETAAPSIKAVVSVDTGSVTVSSMAVTTTGAAAETETVTAIELGANATAESVSGNLAGLNVSVVEENDNSHEIATDIATNTGAATDVGGETFLLYNQTTNTGYNDLSDAIEAANANDTIRLSSDIEQSEVYVFNKTLTLDLNGKTIRAAADFESSSGMIRVLDGGNLTINDSSENGTGTVTADAIPIF